MFLGKTAVSTNRVHQKISALKDDIEKVTTI